MRHHFSAIVNVTIELIRDPVALEKVLRFAIPDGLDKDAAEFDEIGILMFGESEQLEPVK